MKDEAVQNLLKAAKALNKAARAAEIAADSIDMVGYKREAEWIQVGSSDLATAAENLAGQIEHGKKMYR